MYDMTQQKGEIEVQIDGKTYLKRNKYFYEPILIEKIDNSDEEYENYVEILKYIDKFRNLKKNGKKKNYTSFVTNGHEYRYVNNNLYKIIDVTKEIIIKHPDIHKKNLCMPLVCSFTNDVESDSDEKNVGHKSEHKGKHNSRIDQNANNGYSYRGAEKDAHYTQNRDNTYDIYDISENVNDNDENNDNRVLNDLEKKRLGPSKKKKKNTEEINDNMFQFCSTSKSHSTSNNNMLYIDNDYTLEKIIYNNLHKEYQWVSILEDEKMNPGYRNYNHNCFNINTYNKVFTHLILCLLPDGGINKLRVYGEIQKSEKEKQKNYKKTINVSNILDGSSVVYTTDEFYGKAENILIDIDKYNNGLNFFMGWQTKRLINRPLRYIENLRVQNISSICLNNNYCIIKLSYITIVKFIEINTIFYEYNVPLCISIDRCYIKDIHMKDKVEQMNYFNENVMEIKWKQLLPVSYIKGNRINFFKIEQNDSIDSGTSGSSSSSNNSKDFNNNNNGHTNHKVSNNVSLSSHLRLNIYPDGGINTIKVYGIVMEL
uniref:Probable inactive allantoicase n=1 Tax=Piliocolobus tephrosceles TaxID=591936 RepID=A0A8C9GME1_9PRIM